MPAPIAIAPFAWKAAQISAVAALAIYAARKQRVVGEREVWRERALDDIEEGFETEYDRAAHEARAGAAGRLKRTVRIGRDGPGVELDLSGLARLRMRRVPANK